MVSYAGQMQNYWQLDAKLLAKTTKVTTKNPDGQNAARLFFS
jgi:hypothetical protein